MHLAFDCFGIGIAIVCDVPEVTALLPSYLPPREAIGACRIRRRYRIDAQRVTCGRRVVVRTQDPVEACEALEGDVNLYVAEHAPDHVFVHCGVVEWQGRAILLPGRSFAGKSSLVDALVRAGARYASDEYAPLDDRGMVHPFPRALKMRHPQPHRIWPSDCLQQPCPVGTIAVTAWQPGGCWQGRPIAWRDAMMALLANTVPARSQPHRVMAALKRASMNAQWLGGPRGDAAEAAASLLAFAARDGGE